MILTFNQKMGQKLVQKLVSIYKPVLLTIFLFSTYFLSADSSYAKNSASVINEISEIYIEASGNNKHEAKIKAHEDGMKRSFQLLASKMQLPTKGLNKIPYHAIKNVFHPKTILNELSTSSKYSATVTYEYDKGKFYNLLLEYGGEEINDAFAELLVLPVFKQGDRLNIWEKDKKWNDFWADSRDILDRHKIYYPEKNLSYSRQVTENNLFKLDYEDFVNIFNDKLFKDVMIITAEFFTSRKTGDSFVQIKRHVFDSVSGSSVMTEENYDLSSWDDIPYTIDMIIDKIIDEYGIIRADERMEEELDVNAFMDNEAERPIIMNFDVFDQEELDLVISKLENIEKIDKFLVEHDYNTRYKILIYTSVDEYELAESLYLGGLSYKIHGDLYNLIDVKKGG